MKLEIPFRELTEFLRNYYDINISFKNLPENKIRVEYLFSFILTVREVQENEIILTYDSGAFTDLIAKSIHFLKKKKLQTALIEWNAETREISVDLKRIPQLSEYLKFLYISDFRFESEKILILANTKYNL